MIRARLVAVALSAVLLAACEEQAVPDDPVNQQRYTQCQAGNAESCFRLGQYHEGKRNPFNTMKAYERSCELGFVSACHAGAYYLTYVRGTPPDYDQVGRLFRKGCDGSIMKSCTELGWLHHKGPFRKDITKAARLYRKACDGREPIACEILGKLYRDGVGVSRSRTRSAALFRIACEADRPKACIHLAEQHMLGWGLPASRSSAIALLGRACGLGEQTACQALLPTKATPGDVVRTARAWKRAMAAGHPDDVFGARSNAEWATRLKKFHGSYEKIDRTGADIELSRYIGEWERWSTDLTALLERDVRRQNEANSIEVFGGLVGAMREKNEQGDRDEESLDRGMSQGSQYGRMVADMLNASEIERSKREGRQLAQDARELLDARDVLRLRLELRYGVPFARPKEAS